MKLGIQKNLLNNALINLVAFTEKKDASAVTSNILIIAKENILNLKATDFEIGLCVNIKEVNIQVDGISCVNGNLLLNILKGLKDGEIILHETSAAIRSGKGCSVDEYFREVYDDGQNDKVRI